MKNKIEKQYLAGIALFFIAWLLLTAIASSSRISLPMAIGVAFIPILRHRQRIEKRQHQLVNYWPEIIDNIISGLRSGLSTAETIIQLADRGPSATRAIFSNCESILRKSGDLEEALFFIRETFSDPIADQVCETLLTSRSSGGRDTTLILRTLGDFVRGDIALRNEIRAKHGWIKNSAIIATLAPWLLLLILSSQPTTIAAFSTPTGVVVLILGAAMSAVGFLWMTRLGRLEKIPRVFTGASSGVSR